MAQSTCPKQFVYNVLSTTALTAESLLRCYCLMRNGNATTLPKYEIFARGDVFQAKCMLANGNEHVGVGGCIDEAVQQAAYAALYALTGHKPESLGHITVVAAVGTPPSSEAMNEFVSLTDQLPTTETTPCATSSNIESNLCIENCQSQQDAKASAGNPVGQLLEYHVAKKWALPVFTHRRDGPDHSPTFHCTVACKNGPNAGRRFVASASNKKDAKHRAANKMLQHHRRRDAAL